ncbi:glycoside hydrolase family 5 protein [Streptomyces sp. CS7]|uniref:glycoside hydrolase family 5 protein n=1 Tax=Streptomyces sp. CS-7 TaxID=2906769 RepID=UPI0021B4C18F|nr:glycoside hydrolase family 5 protein [Streptomyces sp. CS-7]MCT6780148.1 glycoside hydrolase family 5 protein [Streptomyces sp. CS-7]
MRTRLLAPLVLLLTGALLSPTAATAQPERPGRAAPVAAAQPAASPDWTPPLSTRGRYVVDAEGRRFKLKSGNWHGSSGTWNGSGPEDDPANNHAGEVGRRAPLGLDRKPMGEIIADFRELGLNSVRLPFSNRMIDDTRPVSGLAANPELNGLPPLEVFDRAVRALTDAGFAVILNNHSTQTRWCCGVDGSERWNSGQSTEEWIEDWVLLAERYRSNPRVVGADLRNEVRRDVWDDPNWGRGDAHDWAAAAQRAGDRILKDANPDLLIMVEGINWAGVPVDGFWRDRPHLKPVAELSHTLVRSHKLVYAAHYYGYTGPRHSGATGIGETSDPRYRDLSRAELFAEMHRSSAYVADTPDRHFTAPVWISEFGVAKDADATDRAWFANTVDFLVEHDLDFAYWPVVGFHDGDRGNRWGLVRYDGNGERRSVLDPDDWRSTAWRALTSAPGRQGVVEPVRTWSMLKATHTDANRSLRAAADWDGGARKLTCPDDQRLIGISQRGQGGLCTDAGAAGLGAPGALSRVTSEADVTTDWARGFTKYQCSQGQFMTGYSVRGDRVSAVLCAPARVALAGGGRTLWDDRGDSRPASGEGGDYAKGYHKAQCRADEYAAGIAFSTAIGRSGTPDALYCRRLPG